MSRRERPYLFYGVTRALCAECLVLCDAKELIQDDKVYLWKRCPTHGEQRVLLSDDVPGGVAAIAATLPDAGAPDAPLERRRLVLEDPQPAPPAKP